MTALSTDSTPDALWTAAERWLQSAGFDKIIFMRCTPAGMQVRTTLSDAFQTHYAENGFAGDDPFITHCLPSDAPVGTGKDYLNDYNYLKPRERMLIGLAGEDGFRAGFSMITARGPNGFEGWNVGSSLRRREVELIRKDQDASLRLGLLALRGRLSEIPATQGLTPREKDCLLALASGLRVKAIAHKFGLAPVTVEFHITNARKKLGAATREQAVALLLRGR